MPQMKKSLLVLLVAGFAAGCPATPPPVPKKPTPPAAPIATKPPAIEAGEAESGQRIQDESGDSSAGVSDAPDKVAEASAASTDAADSDARPLDLTRYYIMKAETFDANKRYPWSAMPRGSQTFAGVPLEIGGMFALYGEENEKRGLKYPVEIKGIPIGRPFEALYIGHVAFFEAPAGTPICEVRFQYDDGTTESDQILFGSDARDWYVNTPDEEIGPSGKRSTLAWTGEGVSNDRPQKVRLCLTEIPNPHPEKTVQTIDLVSTKSRSASCILAMTTGKAHLMKPALQAEKTAE